MADRKLKHADCSSQDELITLSKELNMPFRFQPDKTFNTNKYDHTNLPKPYENFNNLLQVDHKFSYRQNGLITFPTLSAEKLNNYCLQQNNNCKHRLSLQLDTIQENMLISKQDKCMKSKNEYLNYTNCALWDLSDAAIQKKINTHNKCESNYQESQIDDFITRHPVQKNLVNNPIFTPEIVLCKDIKKIDNSVIETKDELEKFDNLESDESNSVPDEEQSIEINDFDSEMDLMPNIDAEIVNENSNKIIDAENSRTDSESPTEEMLNEVHRLVNSGLTGCNLSNQPKPPFINSIFPNIPPVIRFVREGESVSEMPRGYKSMMKWRYSAMTPNVVKRAVKRSGFKLTNKPGPKWLGYFGSHMKSPGFKMIMEHQKINHMPGSFQIGRKDRLWRNVTLLASKKNISKDFNFLPKTYCLPADLKNLKIVWDDEESRKKAKWILKPPASARGIGVRVISKWTQIPKKKAVLIQSYVARPFLINGSKFDLRIYVAVTSCDPLRIYIYQEGLVRFASHKYSKSTKNISNRFIHLTNYSVNKKNSDYQNNEDHDKCQGHKWTLQTLWRHLEQDLNIDWKPIWKSIKDCVVKTFISVESHINSNIKMYCTHKSCVYELFGFDVLLDHNLKPWILEVNVSPSLHSNSPLDIEVKSSLISDLFNLVGYQLFENPEESAQPQLPHSRRSSLSASSTPVSETRSVLSSNSSSSSPDKSLCRAFKKQVSLSSLNKSKLRKRSSTKSLKMLQSSEVNCSIPDENEIPLSANSSVKLSSTIKRETLTNKPSSEPMGIDCSNLQHRSYFNRPLTLNEKAKHKFYIQKSIYEDPIAVNTITDKLTVDDARILIESIDEFNRAGNFEILFPTLSEDLESYMSYINLSSGCRYYNYLIVEFMKRYKFEEEKSSIDCESKSKLINSVGLNILEKFSNKLFISSTIDTFWSPPVSKDLLRSKLTLRSTEYQ